MTMRSGADKLLDSTFAALADPTRRAILARLARGDASVGELAQPFQFALPTISRHLKVLERARLIEKRKDASRRHCRLCIEPLREASKWIDRYTSFWESTLESLEDFASREYGGPRPARKSRRVTRAFCPTCGSPVYTTNSGMPDFFIVEAASLDDPARFVPQVVVYTSSGFAWDHVDPALPRF